MMDLTRDDFGVRQAEMTARWYENVRKKHSDPESYIEVRNRAYLNRWKEAGQFISDGADVLDIGGGNLAPMHALYFKERGFNYSYIDVDPSAVASSETVARKNGVAVGSFACGYNDRLETRDESFDAVFSSHCIEHSIDLTSTFSEIWRSLRSDGNLLMAVPFGWEVNPEHPYFLGPNEWIALVEDAGFRVRSAHVGCEYPEEGYDFFIAAQKVERRAINRIDPNDYRKDRFSFLAFTDEAVELRGDVEEKEEHVVLRGDWSIKIEVRAGTSEILPIFLRHEWSGIVETSTAIATNQGNLFSWFPYVQPLRIHLGGNQTRCQVRPIGQDALSYAAEGVLCGILYR